MIIPLIIAYNKEDPCFAGGDIACPPGPSLRNMMVLLLPFRGLSPWGEPSGGGETPHERASFLKTFLQSQNISVQDYQGSIALLLCFMIFSMVLAAVALFDSTQPGKGCGL